MWCSVATGLYSGGVTPSERRKEPRIPWHGPVQLLKIENQQVWPARTVDICGRGALLETPIHLEKGEPVSLDIPVEQREFEGIRATVLRSRLIFWGLNHLTAVEFGQPHQAVAQAVQDANSKE